MATNLNDDMYDVIENDETDGIMTPQLSKYTSELKSKDDSQTTLKQSGLGMILSPASFNKRVLNSRDHSNFQIVEQTHFTSD